MFVLWAFLIIGSLIVSWYVVTKIILPLVFDDSNGKDGLWKVIKADEMMDKAEHLMEEGKKEEQHRINTFQKRFKKKFNQTEGGK